MPNAGQKSSASPSSLIKRLKKAAPSLTLSLDKNKSRTNVSINLPSGYYDGSLDESRRATIALNLMLASLRNEGRSPGSGGNSGGAAVDTAGTANGMVNGMGNSAAKAGVSHGTGDPGPNGFF